MNYIEVSFTIKASKSAEINFEMVREILVAELSGLNFESFVDTIDGLQAYIQEQDFDEQEVKALYILNSADFSIEMEVKTIEQQNWNAEWEKNFEPIEVDGRCLVRAPFHDEKEVDFDIVIEPKMSFGTGHHATTYGMMEMMLNINFTGLKVLDMGCGTGVLAILSEQLGAVNILGIDIEEWAVENALENAMQNDSVS